jgi:prolyl-tRNA synthetase
MKTIEEVSKFLQVKPQQMIKTLVYETEKGPAIALVRGDHELSEAKFKKILGVEELKMATDKVVEQVTRAAVGFAGPAGLKGVKIAADNAVILIEDGVTGANKSDHHLMHVVYGRDYKADLVGDLRFALHEDLCPKCDGGKLQVTRGIEVGHIFKLGTKYSAKMKATYLDENNQEKPYIMGCYGIGVGRTAAAAIEQNNDKDGIIWPINIAPYMIAIVPVNSEEKEQMDVAEKIYEELQKAIPGEVVLDDRPGRVGMKLKDIDLIGFPIKIIIGPKGLKDGQVEVKGRKSGETKLVPIGEAVKHVRDLCGIV